MTYLTETLSRTPPYVWLLLAYILWQGVQALRPRTQTVARVFLVPCLFIASGVLPLFLRYSVDPRLLVAWALAAVLLAPAGYLTGPRLLAVDRRRHTVKRPGSAIPLIRNLTVFLVQYAVAIAVSVHADAGGWLVVLGRAVSGATTGYFLGWAVSAWQQYRAAAP